MQKHPRTLAHRTGEAGSTLLETAVALGMLLVVAIGVMTLATTSLLTTENQGSLVARTAEYAQDKMEQLLSLGFADNASDTGSNVASCGIVTCSGGSVGLGGVMTASSTVGSSDPSAPVNGYVDYLDVVGNPLGGGTTAPAGWYYIRVWSIGTDATGLLKTITITSRVKASIGKGGAGKPAETTVTTMKTFPF